MKGLSEDIVGILVKGKTTKEDYDRLNPLLKAFKNRDEQLKLFVEVVDVDYSASAFWEDFKFSFKYLKAVSAMAVVTDKSWLEGSMEIFGSIWPGINAKAFELKERNEALSWLQSQKE